MRLDTTIETKDVTNTNYEIARLTKLILGTEYVVGKGAHPLGPLYFFNCEFRWFICKIIRNILRPESAGPDRGINSSQFIVTFEQ